MVVRKYEFIVGLALLGACSTKTSTELPALQSESDTTQTVLPAGHDKVLNLDLEQYEVLAESDSGITLPPVDFIGVPQEREAANISRAKGVLRKDLDLIFTLKNGEQLTLTNDLESEEDMVEYVFIRALESIGYWEVLVFYYEGLSYVLINQTTGKKIYLWNKPVVSPKNDYVLCGSCDIEAGFIPNGFQLWQVSGDSLKLQWEKELPDWCAERLVWTNDNFVFGEQMYRDNVSGELKERRIKMRIY